MSEYSVPFSRVPEVLAECAKTPDLVSRPVLADVTMVALHFVVPLRPWPSQKKPWQAHVSIRKYLDRVCLACCFF